MKKKNFISVPAEVAEMAGSSKDLDIKVPLAKSVNLKKLIKDDKNPLFVTIEVLSSGISKSKRNYTPEIVSSIAHQINSFKPEAYEGHIKEDERKTKRPKPMTIWLGAVTKNIDGKLRLFAKGYVLPYAKDLKQYLKAAKASGKKVAVSIYGQARQVWNNLNKVYDLGEFHLESIDWARPGAEGVASLGYLKLTSEMADDDVMNREDIVKDLKLGEVKKLNPKLVSEMKDKAKEELEKDFDKKVETEVKKAKKETVEEMKEEMEGDKKKLNKIVAEQYVDKILKEKVKNPKARQVIKRLVVSEMGSVYNEKKAAKVVGRVVRSAEAKTIIKEMSGKKTKISPQVDNRVTRPGRKYTVIK